MRYLLAALSLCLSTAALADPIQIDDNSENQVLRCEGNPVIVNGNSNNLTLSGNCPSVLINGNQNQVAIEAVDKLRVTGNNNQVSWARTINKGKKPNISNPGSHNQIAQSKAGGAAAAVASDAVDTANDATDMAAAAMSAAGVRGEVRTGGTNTGGGATAKSGDTIGILQGHLTKTFDCGEGKDVNIQGGNNELTFTGSCGTVNVVGAHNVIRLESAETINVMGSYDAITYKSGAPTSNIVGKNSTVAKEK
ncbi:MAG TPA: DUF3060 domain-containing protein [Myxococcaceae bacterium]|nr:DUF3060 domain-containing protein [Myxococcaceae bacterium]